MRALDRSLATAWAEMESLLVSAPELSQARFGGICSSMETRATEWETCSDANTLWGSF
jgi:hypothetical protein